MRFPGTGATRASCLEETPMSEVRYEAAPRSLIFGLSASTFAMVLLFLAAVDSFATILVLRRELGFELNPIMRWLLSHGEAQFLLIKLLLTALCARWIMQRSRHPYARVAALIGLSIYLPIIGLHILNNYARLLLA
jgi:hypothetical protein